MSGRPNSMKRMKNRDNVSNDNPTISVIIPQDNKMKPREEMINDAINLLTRSRDSQIKELSSL